jgi:hypothetical protein
MTETNGGTTELAEVHVPSERGVTLFGTNNPVEVVEAAGKIAAALSDVIEKQGLYTDIKGKKHVRVEGWTLCGTMLGVFPVCVWTRPVEGGFEARVEAKLRDGSIVGGAEAQCTRSESTWANRDDFALRSMAQTRATSKALRLPLGFIVAMGGYSATPAEEMEAERQAERDAKAPATVPGPERRTVVKTAQVVGKVPPTTPRAARPTPIPESAETTVITVTEVKAIKEGVNKDTKEPWTLYAVNGKNDAGVAFQSTTFDHDVMSDAMMLTGKKALIHFTTNGKYKTAIAASPAGVAAPVDPNELLDQAAQS